MSRLKIKQGSTRLSESLMPLYYQVANQIRNGILQGTWHSGGRLPTENELAQTYGVSRPTIRTAKAILAQEGFIHSIKGSGCFVNGRNTWKAQPPTVENLDDIFHYGSKMSFKIHEFGMVSNSTEISRALKNSQDRYVFQIRGVRWHQDKPLSCVVYYLPFRFGSQIPMESLTHNPFIPQFEKLAGIRVVEGIQNITLGRADDAAAKHLGIKKTDTVLIVKTVYFDDRQQPIEYVITRYRGELPYSIRVRRN